MKGRARVRACVWAWVWVVLLATPCIGLFTHRTQEEEEEQQQQQPGMREMLEAISRVGQALETHERHTSLYERVALLETSLAEKTERAMVLEAEVTQLRAKIPELEAEIKTIPEMRKELAEFQANIEKLVHDYEAKLSTLASEVIRLKKSGARHKDLLTLSDGSDVLLRPAPSCPEVGQGMVAERMGEHCMYFSFGEKKNWIASHDHCQEFGAEMAASQVLNPLKQFLRQAFARGPSLWLGSSFNLTNREHQEGKDQNEAEDPSRIIENVSNVNPEVTSNLPIKQDLSDDFQSDGIIGHLGGTKQGLSNPFVMNLKEGPMEEVDQDVSGAAGTLRGMLDKVPMFHDKLLRLYDSNFLADEPTEGTPTAKEDSKSAPDSSVVDIVLLTDSNKPQDTKEHVPSNKTDQTDELDGEEAASGLLPSKGAGLEEAAGSMKQTGKGKDYHHKTGMKCMLLQQQNDSLEYEVVVRPCDEQHNFVCDFKVTIDTLLPEW